MQEKEKAKKEFPTVSMKDIKINPGNNKEKTAETVLIHNFTTYHPFYILQLYNLSNPMTVIIQTDSKPKNGGNQQGYLLSLPFDKNSLMLDTLLLNQ